MGNKIGLKKEESCHFVTTDSSAICKVCYINYLHKSNSMVATQFLHQYHQRLLLCHWHGC